MKAGAIVPRGDILKSNNNWTVNWAPSLQHRVLSGRRRGEPLRYYTGSGVVMLTGSASGTMVNWQSGDLGLNGALEVHNIDRYTSVRRNNQPLAGGEFQHNPATRVMTIPLRGATTVRDPALTEGRP